MFHTLQQDEAGVPQVCQDVDDAVIFTAAGLIDLCLRRFDRMDQ